MCSSQSAIGNLSTLKVYDVLGNEIATLVNEEKQPGTYEVEFDGRSPPAEIRLHQRFSSPEFIFTSFGLVHL